MNLLKKRLFLLLSCEFCKIFQNYFFSQNTSEPLFKRDSIGWQKQSHSLLSQRFKIAASLCFFLITNKNSHTEVFYEKDVLKNFAKFIEKDLCWSFQHKR